jgi:shikimate kinase
MAQAESTRRVFLIGFMGAGKTTVGRELARRLRATFVDLDSLIEQREGREVGDIFAFSGEQAFRRMESAALAALLQESAYGGDLVVALGGGAFIQPENREALKRAGGTTVLLQASLSELQRRCQNDGSRRVRPLAMNRDQFAVLFATRQPMYELAQFHVATENRSIEQVINAIEEILSASKPEVTQS